LTGYELALEIQKDKSLQGMPIIFMTSVFNEDFHIIKGYKSGAVDYLLHPINPFIFTSKVSVFLSLYQKQKKLEQEIYKREKLEQIVSINQESQKFLGESQQIRKMLDMISIIKDKDITVLIEGETGTGNDDSAG
ncbi:MAG: DNA-binding NtrC family response regulator, partial [Candidatus Marinamargulisbacteria bacterium]